jgi:type II secretory pathway component PulJ
MKRTKDSRRGKRILSSGAFAASEVMIALTLFSSVCVGLFMASTSLQRCFAATTDFAVNHADQMRISDYLALDLRRAVSVSAAQNDTTIQIPSYYDASGNPQTPTLDGAGGVNYGPAGTFVTVHYYLTSGSIYRQQGSDPPAVLAMNVQDFIFSITDSGKVVSTRITFNPIFRSAGASSAAIAATAIYNTTLLRNSRRDMVSGVY